jgi:hypothetical protein
MRTGEGTIR